MSEVKKIQSQMQKMGKKMPIFQPNMHEKLQRSLQEMRQASKQLGKKDARPAHMHQQQATSHLQKLRKAIQKSTKNQQGSRPGQKGQNQGKPNGAAPRPGMPRLSRKKMLIPKSEQYKAPKSLRQDILDAMKEKLPRKYKEPVRRYYEKLVK